MTTIFRAWAPATILALGALATAGLGGQARPSLQAPLSAAVPDRFEGFSSAPIEVSEGEASTAGFTDYLLRGYDRKGDAAVPWMTVYVGYYESQTQGRTIHSPKNCLPGSGWEALENRSEVLALPDGGHATVNRYVLQREGERALVLYWYQGRGRVRHNEYLVKWDLLRDAALKRRSDEALVRVVVPITTTEEASFEAAERMARQLIPSLHRSLPPEVLS